MATIKKILDKFLEGLVMLSVIVLVLDVLWQVFTRYASKLAPWIATQEWNNGTKDFLIKLTAWISPSTWTDELATFLLIWVALLGAAVALGRGAHLGIDYFVSKLPEKSRIRTELFVFGAVTLFSLLVMVVGGADLVRTTLRLEQISPALGLDMGYVYLAIPISGIFLVFYGVIGFCERLSAMQEGDAA